MAAAMSAQASGLASPCLLRRPMGAAAPSRTAVPRRASLQIVAMAAKSTGVEEDLSEEFREVWRTAGEESQMDNTFPYGKVDGAHSWHKGDDGTFMENYKAAVDEAGGPDSPGQKAIAWLFLPGFFSIVAFGCPPEYYMGYTVLFLFAYIGIEMGKPSKPSHFEPESYKVPKK